MKLKVAVINKETGKVVGIYEIVEGGLTYTPTKSTAWDTAVRQGDVDADERDKYAFSIQQET